MALATLDSSETVRASVEQALRSGRRDVVGTVFKVALFAALLFSLVILAVLLVTVFRDGSAPLTERAGDVFQNGLAAPRVTRADHGVSRAGISQALRGSLWIVLIVVGFAIPLGVSAGIYLEEYAPRNRVTSFIDLNIRNLAGVPSVVYGILGLAIFVKVLGFESAPGGTVIAAGLTMSVLVLPILIITTAEAVRAVPSALREGAYGVGATRWEVVRSQVLPYAAPGILTGSLLAIARAVGEAAPLILLGAVTGFMSGRGLDTLLDPKYLTQRFTAMPITITEWTSSPYGEFKELAASAIIVLLVFVVTVNAIAVVLRARFEKKR